MESEGGVLLMKKAEIDDSAPFRSVKEAVMLFGDQVLASKVYHHKLKEMKESESDNDQVPVKLGLVTAELEETKESLQKAQEETMLMASCLSSLQQELECTKIELQHLQKQEFQKQVIKPDIEDLKFIENSTKCEVKTQTSGDKFEFERKRYVRFANQPSCAHQVVMPPSHEAVLERHPSVKKKKMKSLIPKISGIFSRKKGGASEMA